MTEQPILESLRRMKEMALNMGSKPPFTARIHKLTWNELRCEINSKDAIVFSDPASKDKRPEIEGIKIEVFNDDGSMQDFTLYDCVTGI